MYPSHPHICGPWLRNFMHKLTLPWFNYNLSKNELIQANHSAYLVWMVNRLLSGKNGCTESDRKLIYPTLFSDHWYLGRNIKMAQTSVCPEYFPICQWFYGFFPARKLEPELVCLCLEFLVDSVSWVWPVPLWILGSFFIMGCQFL